jgi:hypothetical protein
MSPTTLQSALDANLRSLGERNAEVAEQIRGATGRTDVEFSDSPQGVPAATVDGRQLCSRHRPLDEATRIADSIDILDNAVVVVLGFGLGYHVQQLAKRTGKAAVIIVFEPDVELMKAVFERIDHSSWLAESMIVWVTDPDDSAALSARLTGAEAIVAQGVAFLEHPASRNRLGEAAAKFTAVLGDQVTSIRTTLMTTLIRSVETVRNLLLNLDHYTGGAGIAELRNVAAGRPAVVVSAGPSLQRNIHHLAEPGVRDRCVIVAVQTTLKPLLEAGVRPHFVTALDYHEISRRFYDAVQDHDLSDITLIAEPKAHPVILDSYPGPIRCCHNGFCDQLLGNLRRDMGEVPAGGTVAHLALYVARFLGCDPIAMVGQDLGFTDGLYYTPGTAIDDVWAPELNPFNTIEMMQWQRIARHRVHLQKTTDHRGRSIYSDAQMMTYLQQFERDFGELERAGVTIIDATEGGVVKRHATPMPLGEVLERHATEPLPAWPVPDRRLDPDRLSATADRVRSVRTDVAQLREISAKSTSLIESMLADQHDAAKMQKHFERIDRHRREVEQRMDAFELLNQLNQLGVYKRFRADRRLKLLAADADPVAVQRGQLERDLENVTWIADSAGEFIDQLARAEQVLRGETVDPRPSIELSPAADQPSASRVAALVPVERATETLQTTLERLGRCSNLESIILIAPDGLDVDAMLDREAIGLPVEIERTDGSPFPPEQHAITAARAWSRTCWRGGIAGMSVYDEVLCPQVMHPIMTRRGLTAGLLVAPDWPHIDVSPAHGCEAVVARHKEHPDQHKLVFTQAPPEMGGCLVATSLMAELVERTRLATIGSLLVYQPQTPQGDPIARDACVQIPASMRAELVRTAPRAIELDLTSARHTSGRLAELRGPGPDRGPMSFDEVREALERLAEPQCTLTLGGAGDPLLHDRVFDVIAAAHDVGIRHVHVRTDLLCDGEVIDRLATCDQVDVVSVELHADRAATYETMMGCPRFTDVLSNLERLVHARPSLAGSPGWAALALPWVVPRLVRCRETYEDINSFYDRWQHQLGTCVIDASPSFDADDPDELSPAVTPPQVVDFYERHRVRVP